MKNKRVMLYGLSIISLGVLCGTLFYVNSNKNNSYSDKEYNYVTDTIFENDVPVIGEVKQILKPSVGDNVSIKVNYYDYKSSEDNQKNSLIYYENTYLQNSGIVYGADTDFDVVSVLDGTVIEVKEDAALNQVVSIRHSNEVISVYRGLKDVTLKVNDVINGGTIIGKSSSSNMLKNYKSTLLFELVINGNNVNPEDYYNKTLEELS